MSSARSLENVGKTSEGFMSAAAGCDGAAEGLEGEDDGVAPRRNNQHHPLRFLLNPRLPRFLPSIRLDVLPISGPPPTQLSSSSAPLSARPMTPISAVTTSWRGLHSSSHNAWQRASVLDLVGEEVWERENRNVVVKEAWVLSISGRGFVTLL